MTDRPRRPGTAAARRLQRCLARRVSLQPDSAPVARIAAVDCAFPDRGRTVRAAAVLMAWPGLAPLGHSVATMPAPMPYVPGLLSFRELPAVRQALDGLDAQPDLVLCDGQGIAHPRRLGIAAHLGVVTGLRTIGVGKSRLIGAFAPPAPEKGAWSWLLDGDERLGSVLRTRQGVRPLFVSPGHRVDHAGARSWVLACCTRYRLPDPIRAADHLAGGGRPAQPAAPG